MLPEGVQLLRIGTHMIIIVVTRGVIGGVDGWVGPVRPGYGRVIRISPVCVVGGCRGALVVNAV